MPYSPGGGAKDPAGSDPRNRRGTPIPDNGKPKYGLESTGDRSIFGNTFWDPSGVRVNRSVRDTLRAGIKLTDIQSSDPEAPGYVKDADKSYIMLPFASGSVKIHLGSLGQDLYRLSDPQTTELQRWLFDGGYYDPEVYEDGTDVITGNPNDRGYTSNALRRFFGSAMEDGRDIKDFLRDSNAQGQEKIAAGLTGDAEEGPGQLQSVGDTFVDNPFQAIEVTHATTLEGVADNMARDVFGRKATAEERAKFVTFFQNIERFTGVTMANREQQDRMASAQNSQMGMISQAQLNNTGMGPGGQMGAGGAGAYAGGRAVIDAAMTQLGDPYVWGAGRAGKGSDPGGFDCSGLTYWAYQQVGITLPGTADAQYRALPKVTNPQPGDLVFFESSRLGPGRASHVGIYMGGNKVLDAPNRRSTVSINDLSKKGKILGYGRPGGAPVPTNAGARSVIQTAGGVMGGGAGNGIPYERIMATIKGKESAGDYTTGFKGKSQKKATASGGYGFTNDTWMAYRGSSRATRAKDASPAEQDAAAKRLIDAHWATAKGDVSLIPVLWYIGHLPSAAEWDQVPHPEYGNKLTVREYQTAWLATYKANGGVVEGGGGVDGGGGASTAGPGGYMGGVHGSGTANTYEVPTRLDMEMAAEKQFRQDHPDEAGAHDMADQYDQFVTLLSGFSGQRE